MFRLRNVLIGIDTIIHGLLSLTGFNLTSVHGFVSRHSLEGLWVHYKTKYRAAVSSKSWEKTKPWIESGVFYKTRTGRVVFVVSNTDGWYDKLPFIVMDENKTRKMWTVDEKGWAYPPTLSLDYTLMSPMDLVEEWVD